MWQIIFFSCEFGSFLIAKVCIPFVSFVKTNKNVITAKDIQIINVFSQKHHQLGLGDASH